ncbi:MAG: sigma 54-interacting transcriptional regulator, partial [Myxococcota bacterium]
LAVDPDEAVRRTLAQHLPASGCTVELAATAVEARARIETSPPDLLLVSLPLSGGGGQDLIHAFKDRQRDGVVLVMADRENLEPAVKAMNAGAFDCVLKPLDPIDFMQRRIEIALDHMRLAQEFSLLRRENQSLRGQMKTREKFAGIVAQSESMRAVLGLVEKVAETDSTVLILGESGTGKELVARAIHHNSPRRDQLLVAVNCSAIPGALLESELFGHVKGAFTGAISSRVGRFQLADGGTIFLDEIGDMPQNLQVRLLRVLQEQEFMPVGASRTVKVNVRVIAATNQNLETAIYEKRFREDLYYRLNVIPIRIPPLRERPEDVRVLARHFIEIHNDEQNKTVKGLSDEALGFMEAYDWPGNVRELEHTLERVVIMKGEGEVRPEDLPDHVRYRTSAPARRFRIDIPSTGIAFNALVRDFENELILQALEKTRWNKNRAAALLQLNRTTLVEKIKKKQLRRSSSRTR